MTEWQPEAVVDEALARRLVCSQFPDIPARTLRLLGEGWDNTVWLADDAWLFRFPRREVALPLVERTAAILPALAPRLPLPIPVPELEGAPADGFPWPFHGFPVLPGRELADAAPADDARAALGTELGRFLRALHDPALPAAIPGATDLPLDANRRSDAPFRAGLTRRRFEELAALGLWEPPPEARTLVEDAAALPPTDAAPVLVHGDLHARHLLVDDAGRATAVIDWDDACLADPAVDLVLVWAALPQDGRAAFLDAYGPVAPQSELRARLLALFLSATLLLYAHHEGRPALGREALAGLARATA